jgi:hypothetical protein
MLVLRDVFLSLHVAGGVVGLLIGAFAIRPPLVHQSRLWLRRAYATALIVLLVFLTGTIAIDWTGLQVMQQVIYVVLIGLAVFMVIRALLAFQVARQQAAGWETEYMDHIYFTYISLWEGFFIVGLIDLGAPAWLTAAVAMAVLILGAVLLRNYSRRFQGRPATA